MLTETTARTFSNRISSPIQIENYCGAFASISSIRRGQFPSQNRRAYTYSTVMLQSIALDRELKSYVSFTSNAQIPHSLRPLKNVCNKSVWYHKECQHNLSNRGCLQDEVIENIIGETIFIILYADMKLK